MERVYVVTVPDDGTVGCMGVFRSIAIANIQALKYEGATIHHTALDPEISLPLRPDAESKSMLWPRQN